MPNRLKDKVAVVVGAGSSGPGWGNGKATAVLFAREGAKVVAADINLSAAEETAKIIKKEGGKCEISEVDVTKSESIAASIEAACEVYGHIDVLHNNVGVTGNLRRPLEVSETDWDQVFSINVKSMYLTCNAVLPSMLKLGKGSIINISSIAAIRYIGIPYIPYAASKAAILQLTQSIALEYADKGIRCNAILPGLIDTPLVHSQLKEHYGDIDEMLAKRNEVSPTGKMGEPLDVAYAALYLASDESKYVNGTSLVVDGGLTAGVAQNN